jgi:hypothetical protein
MYLEQYETEINPDCTVFEFLSVGKRETVKKIIIYEGFQNENLFYLAFGDVTHFNRIDDRVITNNGDIEKVISTIIKSLYTFTDNRPDALILITSNRENRTRLYRSAFSKYIDELQKDFSVHGYLNKKWNPFEKNVNYSIFLIKRKANEASITNNSNKELEVTVNPDLDKYLKKPVFIEKLSIVNCLLETVGLPNEYNDLIGNKIPEDEANPELDMYKNMRMHTATHFEAAEFFLKYPLPTKEILAQMELGSVIK